MGGPLGGAREQLGGGGGTAPAPYSYAPGCSADPRASVHEPLLPWEEWLSLGLCHYLRQGWLARATCEMSHLSKSALLDWTTEKLLFLEINYHRHGF